MLWHRIPRAVVLSLGILLSLPIAAQPVKPTAPESPYAALERARAQASKNLDASVFDSIALQYEIADRISKDYPTQANAFRARAAGWLKTANEGRDPLQAAAGQIVMRGYSSAVSRIRQGYAVYLPRNYDPSRAYPLMMVLHGGSANGNLFLGVVLGNNMNWKEYDYHLWDDFTPRYHPDWIVVAPDGFGQIMWRFMGEQDVLDVLDDVQRHYHVDSERVVLAGLSNGGVGAYSLGMRHASRFSAVLAIAGAPSWLQYAGGKIDPLQSQALRPLSAMELADNAINTDFRFFHGKVDPGPMRPAFVEAFGRQIAKLGVPYTEKWFDTGHDLLYLVVRQGALFKDLEKVTRKHKPSEVRLVSGDHRAAQQHWLRVTSFTRLPELARLRALARGDEIQLEVSGADAFEVAWKDAPLADSPELHWVINGVTVAKSAKKALQERVSFTRVGEHWRLGSPELPKNALRKQPGSAGPVTDAYYGRMLHVYGTGNPAHTAELKKQAERGARGWPLWLWRVDQPVIPDTEVSAEQLRDHDLVLYATPGSHALLSRIEAQLPIRVEADAVVVGKQRFTDKGVGTKFIYPNPLNPKRYVIVQAAPTLEAVKAGYNLPDFLPDYVVYDAKTTRARPRLLFPSPPPALGYFDQAWQIDETHTQRALMRSTLSTPPSQLAQREGDGPESADQDNPPSPLPVPVAPEAPAMPQEFATEATSQAGKAAREIAKRVASFTNFRSKIAGATWRVEQTSVWSIREAEACLSQLSEHGVQAQPWKAALPTPVATPVKLQAAVSGVSFHFMHAAAGSVISCELAARLRDIAEVVSKHGVHTVWVMSAYRDHPFPSFHTLGLALDLSRFDTEGGPLLVKSDYVVDRARETCAELPSKKASDKHRKLQAIACDLAASGRFSSVLTPNYNAGHRDHFHVDIRPNDPRLFIR